jgi:hypothetical protein
MTELRIDPKPVAYVLRWVASVLSLLLCNAIVYGITEFNPFTLYTLLFTPLTTVNASAASA